MTIGVRVYIGQEKFASERDTKGFMLFQMWSYGGINKPCFFKCPPAREVCALSKIPLNTYIFLTSSLFTNMDHEFWRVLPLMDDYQFAWILLYIW